ncbi:MAG: hypothetical protein WC292_01545 [Clostridia bacterium]
MTNGKLTKQQIEAWEQLYAKDLPIIGGFLKAADFKKNYRLYFKDGTQLVAFYDGCGDGDNDLELDDPYYEDLYEFYFIVKKVEQKGSELKYKEDEWIILNYHNFFVKFELYEGEI